MAPRAKREQAHPSGGRSLEPTAPLLTAQISALVGQLVEPLRSPPTSFGIYSCLDQSIAYGSPQPAARSPQPRF